MKRAAKTPSDAPEPFEIRFGDLVRKNPEARAHLNRIEALIDKRVIQHPRVQAILQRQIAQCISEITRNGIYLRWPADDHELLRVQSEVSSGG